MRFGRLEIDPALSPGVLDTATWDRAAALAAVHAVDDAYWPALLAAATTATPLPAAASLTPYAASVAWHRGALYCLAFLPDGQQIFLEIGPGAGDCPLGAAIGAKTLPPPSTNPQSPIPNIRFYPTAAAVIDRFFRRIASDKGSQALGQVPRLGIGTRMTTAVWPAIWQAMAQYGFAANAIQNSVRELNFMETLLAGRPAEKNIAFGFGTIETGYTGSSYEGLWVAGALNALKHGAPPRYGADADHIQVKRGPDGLARAKRLLDATRYYSFYTLDVSDVLDYAALSRPAGRAAPQDLLAYHRQPRRFADFDYRPDTETLERLAAKYGVALDAVGELYRHICQLKADHEQGGASGAPFDLELSIDEHPNEVPTFDCLTSETELIFVLLEAQRRGLPLTHVAPNFGVEKGTDYRGADGLAGFAARTATLCRITETFGLMPDFHSGDDLSAATRQAIGRATGGRNHFKVSPMLQLLFGEVLAEHDPELFGLWHEDAVAYARREAAAGSAFAAECICKDLTPAAPPSLAGKGEGGLGEVFHHFSFAFVGRRDSDGQFLWRERFYSLPASFYRAYQDRIARYLGQLAEDLCLTDR